MTNPIEGFEILESLNPVPAMSGNPGAAPIGSRRIRVQRVLAAAVVTLIVATVGLAQLQPSDPVPVEVATSSTPAVASTASGEPAPGASLPGLAPSISASLSDGREEGEHERVYAVGRLLVDAIELDLVFGEGVDEDSLRNGPGHYPETPFPGQAGNAAIAGHRTTYGAPFHRLDELALGDEIETVTIQGSFTYVVSQIVVADASDVGWLDDFGDNRITLTTSHPKYASTERIIVVADLIGEPAAEAPILDMVGIADVPGGWLPQPKSRDPVSFRVTAAGDGFVAVTSHQAFSEPGEMQVLASFEGQGFRPIPSMDPFRADSAAVTWRDGTLHVVGIRDAGDGGQRPELFHLRSENLVDWSAEYVEPLPTLADPERRWTVAKLVAGDAGVMVSLDGLPHVAEDAGIEGIDTEVCDYFADANRVTYRLCGETEPVTVDLASETFDDFGQRWRMLFRPYEAPFEAVAVPGSASRAAPTIFPLGDGFGVTIPDRPTVRDPSVFVSTDGRSWEPVETGRDFAPQLAERNGDRVYLTWRPPARLGDADVAVGMAFSAARGPWQPIDLRSLYDHASASQIYFPGLLAGDAGWVAIAQRKVGPADTEDLDRRLASGASEFELRADGFVLTGQSPFGPATLRDAEGAVVREWDHLEVKAPLWSGFTVGTNGISLDTDDGRRSTVTFSSTAWSVLAYPNETFAFDVLFSADGTNWSVVAEELGPVGDVAIGSDRIVVTHLPVSHRFVPASLTGPSPFVAVITVPASG